jgi:hypothetical protein
MARKAILEVIEQYVLKTLGQLPADGELHASALVKRVFGGGPDWPATVRAKLGWTVVVDKDIHDNWARYQAAAKEQGSPIKPGEFAEMFADLIDQMSKGKS